MSAIRKRAIEESSGRIASSFQAIHKSLTRPRLAALDQGLTLGALLFDDDRAAWEDDTEFDVDDEDTRLDLLRGEIAELWSFVAVLAELTGEDTNAAGLVSDLNDALATYVPVGVFTQYTDTMDYVRKRLVAAGYGGVGR